MGKNIVIQAHCSDMFTADLYAEDGNLIDEYGPNYVPDIFGDGDDVLLEIDIETGQILNWKATEEDINKIFKKYK